METNGFPNDEQHDEFDLAQYDDDFAGAPVEEKEFEEPPDGKYQVLVGSRWFAEVLLSLTLRQPPYSAARRSLDKGNNHRR